MKSIIILAIVAILVVGVGASYKLSGNLVKTNNIVKIGYIPIALSLPVYVAEENGYFQSEGVEYELVTMDSTDSIIKGLVDNQIDAAFEVSLAPVLSYEEKNPGSIKIFSVSDLTSQEPFDSIIIKQDSGLKTLKDLEGKRLGILPGQTGKTLISLFKEFLRPKGVDSESIQFISVAPDAQISALANGDVDAVLTFEPTVTQAMQSIQARRLYGSFLGEQIEHNPQGAAIFTSEFVKDNPVFAKKIVNIFDKSADYVKSNETGARKILSNRLRINTQVTSYMALFRMTKSLEIDKKIIQKYITVLNNVGLLGKKLDGSSLIYSGS